MDAQDIETQDEWLYLVVAGRKETIDKFWTELGGALPVGWSRDQEAERDRKPRSSPVLDSMCFALAQPTMRVWVYRLSPIRVQGGRVDQVDPTDRTRYLRDTAQAIRSFRCDVLDPTVKRCGLCVSSQRLGPHSLTPVGVLEALWRFSEATEFQWPPAGEARQRWDEFVRTGYQRQVAFDPGELTRWLVEKGWAPPNANRLVEQMAADATILSKFDDVRESA